MDSIKLSELFPSKSSVVVFITYMALFVNQGILVTASQTKNNQYAYNIVTVVLLTELLKLIISTCLYCKDHTFVSLIADIARHWQVLLLYFIPAFLYCLYNNLSFINLSAFDPTTLYLLLQLRVVITGILFQIIFNKKLSHRQWLSLILLTIGCMLKQINFGDMEVGEEELNAANLEMDKSKKSSFSFDIHTLFLLIQIVCSCLAGVYNEYLLKNRGQNVNIFVQNVFMYLDSIICNCLVLILQGRLLDVINTETLAPIFNFTVVLIIINNACVGIVTSFFLRILNSILKTFASALELIFTAVLCWLIFGIPIYYSTVLSIVVVSYAIVLYTQNPVQNPPKLKQVVFINDDVEKKLIVDGEISDY